MAKKHQFHMSPYDSQIIHQDHFSAYSINEGNTEKDNIHSVVISDLKLDSYNFPRDAELQLNIKCGKNDMRYVDLGTVDNWSQPNEIFDFTGINKSIEVKLCVNPAGKSEYIGYSSWRTCWEGDSKALLKVHYEDLGQITWIFKIESDSFPSIILNEKKSELLGNLIKQNRIWQGQIVPQCLYSGYMHIAKNRFENTLPENDGSWEYDWWQKAEQLSPDETKDIKDKDEADFHIWAKNLSIKHCSQYKYLDKFIDWVDGGKNSG